MSEKVDRLKQFLSYAALLAGDEKGEAQPGDTVRVYECRPYSKLKKYRLGAVLKKAR